MNKLDPKIIKKTKDIALKNAHSCCVDEGILAGKRNFVDFWARDSFWASFGLITEGNFSEVKKNLLLFLNLQRESGQIPYRIISINQFLKYLHIKKRFKKPLPNYNSILGASVVDTNLLLPIVLEHYFLHRKDDDFLKDIFPKLELSNIWLRKQDKDQDHLLEEGFLANWMDHLFKRGKVLISNILYYKSQQSLSILAKQIGNLEQYERYLDESRKIKQAIQKNFWTGTYFVDWIDYKKHYYFDTSANLLACLWGITDKKQTRKILQFTKEKTYNGFVPKANYPNYHPFLVQPHLYLAGIADYGGYRIWIGAIYALALKNTGYPNEAQEVLYQICKKVAKHEKIYELYNKGGKPTNRWIFYTNEEPFIWSAGTLLWAIDEVF